MPTSLHPQLARCCVNLTGIKKDETLLDPFCGTGGILIEAGLMGLNCIGGDISDWVLKKCRENIKESGLNIEVKQQELKGTEGLINDQYCKVVRK